MPPGSRFRHQRYDPESDESRVEFLRPEGPPPPDSESFRLRMQGVGAVFRRAGVTGIHLVHGTFAGTDALGIFRELARLLPAPAARLGRLEKRIVDQVSREAGNYTPAFAAAFERSINPPDGPPDIPVRILDWTGENHHAGRADGAVRLLDRLAGGDERPSGRLLLWGHSHGGNILALVTNLLASDRTDRRRFFYAARSLRSRGNAGMWERVRRRLDVDGNPLAGIELDLVTFGTPVRYGWNTAGCSQLLHVVFHRPKAGSPPHRAAFPPSPKNVLTAAGGDYIQQLGIAGTDLGPGWLAWRTWLAERRLKRLLQCENLRRGNLVARLRAGLRAHEDGKTLLVDYGPPRGNLFEHLAGHAIYTRPEWLLFHADEVARRFYGAGGADSGGGAGNLRME